MSGITYTHRHIKGAEEMNILFLDDDRYRHEMFVEDVSQHPENKQIFLTLAHSYAEFVQVTSVIKTWDIIFLDHDLGVEDQMCIPHVTNRFPTGSDVARYMVENNIKAKKIIIHSYNYEGARNMMGIFKDHGIESTYHPYDASLKDHLA